MSQVSFAQLPDDIVEKIVDEMDFDSLKNFGLTSKKCASFLNCERIGFKVVKDKVKESLRQLGLSNMFKSLDEIDNFQQISSQPVEYAMSPNGFTHTILCLNHMKKISMQHDNKRAVKRSISFCRDICRTIFFCLFMILGAVSIGVFVVSFATANEMYYQYPEGKIVTKIPIVKEVEHAEEFEKEQRLYLEALFNGDEKKDDVWRKPVFFEEEKGKGEEEEEEEEEEKKYRTESKNIFFLWHFTSAAVCLSLSLTFLILAGIIFSDEAPKAVLLLLLLIPLLLPAVRMDEFTKVTYLVFFIPAMIGMAAVFLLVLVFQIKPTEFAFFIPNTYAIGKYETERDNNLCLCWVFRVSVPLAYLLLLAGFVLFVIRIDNRDALSQYWLFHFTIILAFPLSAVLLLQLVCGVLDYCPFLPLALPPIVHGIFILPFCLRKDGMFTTSYHYVLIPWYLVGGCVLVGIVFYMAYTADGKCRDIRFERYFNSIVKEGLYTKEMNLNRFLRETLLGERNLHEVNFDMLDDFG